MTYEKNDSADRKVSPQSGELSVDKESGKSAGAVPGREAFSEKVREILPEAVAGSLSDDDRLANALYPTVERSLTRSVKKDSRPLVDAIFPILGPMIRRNIAETMRGMVQSLNRSVEYTFSIRGLKWRWEAFITRKPFAEVVMLHSLAYRVEQVFLIHKKTGLLLLHVASDSITGNDNKENMVSAMLTAIQDFVHDSFSSEADSQLSSIQIGDLNVWLEQCSDVVVAGVVRGDLPQSVQTQLRETAERVQSVMQDELEDFEGDVEPFERVRYDMESCLKEQINERKRLIPLTWIILIAPVIAFLGWGALTTTENWQWRKYVRNVRSKPGLIVIEEGSRNGEFYIIGMRDALAADPAALLKEQPLISHQVKSQWIPYQSLQPDFVLKRAKDLLQPPESVSLKIKDGVLVVIGSAPHEWVESLQNRALAIAGITGVNSDELTDEDAGIISAWNEFRQKLKTMPGILLTTVEESGLTYNIEGFRDPLAIDPVKLLGNNPILKDRVQLRLEPYNSVVPEFTLKRAQAILNPPDSITLDVNKQNVLVISGHAKRDWLERTKVLAPSISGVSGIDDSDLHDIDGNRKDEWLRYLDLLEEAPGLVVIEHGESDGKFNLIGFRSKLGADPYEILKTVGVSKRDINAKWLPSPDVSRRFVLSHAQEVLSPPPSVTLQRIDKTLIATGSAPHDWIRESRIIARCLPGIIAFNDDLLVDEDFESMDRMRYKIEKVMIICRKGSAIPAAGQEAVIADLADTINKLHATALKLNSDVTIVISGSAEDALTQEGRLALAGERAAEFRSLLMRAGVPGDLLKIAPAEDNKSVAENNAGQDGGGGITFQVQIVTPESE